MKWYIKYRNLIVQYLGDIDLINKYNRVPILGKGIMEIIENWCGDIDYYLEWKNTEGCSVQFIDNKVLCTGLLEEIRETTIIETVIFLLNQRKNYLNGIASFHASAVVKGNMLLVFLGGKGSGKTSISHLLVRKCKNVKLIANDYLEIKMDKKKNFSIIYTDIDKEITFRSHVLYEIDHELYKSLMGINEAIFNQDIKYRYKVETEELKREALEINKIYFIFVGMGKTEMLEISEKIGIELKIQFYKELVQYIRGKSVAIIQGRKTIAPIFLDTSKVFTEEVFGCVDEIISNIENNVNINVKWVRGQWQDIERYLEEEILCI